jgi:hypothetical protein
MEVYQNSLQRAVIAIQYLVTVYQSTGDHGGVLYFGHTTTLEEKIMRISSSLTIIL